LRPRQTGKLVVWISRKPETCAWKGRLQA